MEKLVLVSNPDNKKLERAVSHQLGSRSRRVAMQVVVFISKADGKKNPAPILLILPDDPGAAIPKHLQPIEWNYFATVSVTDALLGASPEVVVDDLERYGYSLVSPTH